MTIKKCYDWSKRKEREDVPRETPCGMTKADDVAALTKQADREEANIHLTHHFYGKLLAKGQKGCVVYTSSSAGFIPNPFAVGGRDRRGVLHF